MNIIRGKQLGAKKVCIYGPEGIGKSTFAAQFPNPLFIDTEGSTKEMDVARFEKPNSWQMIFEQIRYIKAHPTICGTLVIDTIDWAEMLCIEFICANYHKDGLESFGYGTGYVYVREAFGKLLNRLEELIERNIHVVLTAHAQIRKFEQPDELGAYDRYELKLGKKTGSQTSPLVKEWADMVLFANYKTQSVAVDKKGQKHKAQGGRRVMYTAHHPCWDAKNRHNLAEELPFEYGAIAHCITDFGNSLQQAPEPAPVPAKQIEPQAPAPAASQEPAGQMQMPMEPAVQPQPSPPIIQEQPAPAAEQKASPPEQKQPEPVQKPPHTEHPEPIPKQPEDPEVPKAERIKGSLALDEREEALKQLFDLMERTGVDRSLLQRAVGMRGFYTDDTPIEHYTTEFLKWLPTQWERIDELIKQLLEKDIPF